LFRAKRNLLERDTNNLISQSKLYFLVKKALEKVVIEQINVKNKKLKQQFVGRASTVS
jgi:hypothetical protein